MKPHINSDFIRGILFAYAAYNLWLLLGALKLGISPYQPIQFWFALLFVGLYGFVAFGLLFMPLAFSKPIFILLGALSLLPILSRFYAAKQYPEVDLPALGHEFYISFILGIGAAGLAYLFYRQTTEKTVS